MAGLPSTELLRGLGTAGGAGLGGALGGVLDQPRRALTNLAISPFTGQDGQGGAYNPAAAIPGALGVAAGAAAAMSPLAPFAGLIGAGVGGLAQAAADVMAPEAVNAPSTGDLVRALGQDPGSLQGMVLGAGLGFATDPLTWAGGVGGGVLGGEVGAARDGLEQSAQALARQQARVQELKRMQQLADHAVAGYENPVNAWADGLMADVSRGQDMSYRADVMDAMPDFLNAPLDSGKTYKQVDPRLAQDLQHLGLGQQTQGGLLMTAGQAPDFSQVRGGWLKPTQARADMLAGVQGQSDTLPVPGLRGPNLDPSRGYMGVLDDPAADYSAMRQQMGWGELGQAPAREPSLVQALGSQGPQLYDNPLARIDNFPVQGVFPGDPTKYRQGNLGDLPLYAARDRIGGMLQGSQDQLAQLLAQQPTGMQRRLMDLGLAGGHGVG